MTGTMPDPKKPRIIADFGANYVWRGASLIRVGDNPAKGQYSVDETTGIYTFSAPDARRRIIYSFETLATRRFAAVKLGTFRRRES